LQRRPKGHHLVGVYVRERRLAEDLADPLAHQRHTCRAADHDDALQFTRADAGIGEDRTGNAERALDRGGDQGLELRPGQSME